MHEYLFVWERSTHSFPKRFWIKRSNATEPSEIHQLDGCIEEEKSEEAIEKLRSQYPEPNYQVARMHATNWQTVADNYPGLLNE